MYSAPLQNILWPTVHLSTIFYGLQYTYPQFIWPTVHLPAILYEYSTPTHVILSRVHLPRMTNASVHIIFPCCGHYMFCVDRKLWIRDCIKLFPPSRNSSKHMGWLILKFHIRPYVTVYVNTFKSYKLRLQQWASVHCDISGSLLRISQDDLPPQAPFTSFYHPT